MFFTHTESQGIALAEAWSMDVPTFIYEANQESPLHIFSRRWYQADEVPYINHLNGMRWSNPDLLVDIITGDRKTWPFNPRLYVLNTMTDEIAMKNVFQAIKCEWKRRFNL